MRPPVFFQPVTGWVGDVIPVAHDGAFWLYYLHELRADPKPGTPWNLVTTTHGVDFDDRGVAFPHGGPDDPDFNVYTGSIVRGPDGIHHLFYTGQNPRRLGADGQPLQLVMHATSDDGMASWSRHGEHTVGAPEGFETADWRDPFVFQDDRTGLWRMLVAARHDSGPARRRGVIAQLTSPDLVHWTPVDPFWDPRRYVTHECPDVFRWGDWWYLVYSEFTDSFTTRYRMARTPDGPWLVPEHDSVDGRAFYASKSAELGGRRFFFGWIATKERSRDDGAWQWAGTMSVLEAHQRADGTLGFGFAPELLDSFTERLDVALPSPLPLALRVPDGYASAVSTTVLPAQYRARLVVDIAGGTTECGLLLRASADGDEGYVIRLEPRRGRMVFDRWPRAVTGAAQWQVSGDVPFVIELERPCDLGPGEHTLDVVVDDDLCVAVLDGQVALSTRIYDRTDGRIGVFAGEGSAVIRDLHVFQRAETATPSPLLSQSKEMEEQ
ncbi:GH32 C-terminal domain-containing protein [Galbitalea soli]|uniref:beta-fructofuranosidase n=1 Tax=Galbitalea soli TaxID=1268042 RepID=A0A7C9PMT1_9MICO|nr:GH32 C-terminal domain-containing protein [Galbitalea soli]NEM91132.1 family 43 glycosylhydrolase [Galbitalea soli]NYJ29821.1 beta-fructofuranosidase [Galbitalea soli]